MHPTPTPSAGATLPDLRGSYRLALRARGLVERTVDLYLEALDSFTAYGAAHGQPAEVAAIRRAHVEAWVVDALERHSPATVNLEYRSLQQFWRWAIEDDETAVDPMARMRPPRIPEKAAPVLEAAAINRLLAAAAGRSLDDRRDKAIITLLADTGIRRGESPASTSTTSTSSAASRSCRPDPRSRDGPGPSRSGLARPRRLTATSGRDGPIPTPSARPRLWLGLKGPMTVSGINQALNRRCRRPGCPGSVRTRSATRSPTSTSPTAATRAT